MSRSPKRYRGVVLTQGGVDRLEAAIATAQDEEKYGKRFTQAELAERSGLSIKTIKKIRQRTRAIDEGSIRLFFDAFGLELAASDYGVPETSEAISSQSSTSETKTVLSRDERLSLIRSLNGLPPSQFEEMVYALDLPRGIIATGIDAQGNRAKALLDWAEGPTGCGIDGVLNLLAQFISLETLRTPQDVRKTAVYSKAPIASTSSKPLQSPSLDNNLPPKIDWGEKPDTAIFFGRTEELVTLHQWVITEQCRVVTLLGMGGIGKTFLAAELTNQIQQKFDQIIWRSLREAPPLDEILFRLIQFLSNQQRTPSNLPISLSERINCLLHYLRQSRCLLVLDNIESILQAGPTGKFLPDYDNYRALIKHIGEGHHQSCLIVTSRECPEELAFMAGENLPVRLLQVTGVSGKAGIEILRTRGLHISIEDSQGQKLLERYSGNPQALSLAATTIRREYFGDVDNFLSQPIGSMDKVHDLLGEHLKRLTSLEMDILFWLAINREPVSIDDLLDDLWPLTTKDKVRKSLVNLQDRCLVETVEVKFTLQNVIMQFSTEKLIEQIIHELKSMEFIYFNTHAIIKTTTKDYIRETQIRLILSPISRLNFLVDQGKIILEKFRLSPDLSRGYGPGNLFNLLCFILDEFSDYDFSSLILREIHMRGKQISRINFANSDFRGVSLTQTFGMILTVGISEARNALITGDSNGNIQLWGIKNKQLISILQGHKSWVWSVKFSPNGNIIASGSEDGSIRLWDVKTQKHILLFQEDNNWV